MPRPYTDLSGQKFGHLVPMKYVGGLSRNGHWICRCERCGGTELIAGFRLKRSERFQCRECNLVDRKAAKAKNEARRKRHA